MRFYNRQLFKQFVFVVQLVSNARVIIIDGIKNIYKFTFYGLLLYLKLRK